MNKFIKSTFDDLKREEASYRQSVESALSDYRRAMEKAKSDAGAYKDEAAFLDALRLYFDFDICPSHAEISALMEQNGGCTLGYRTLNRTLEKTKAEWRVDAPDAGIYESDLAALEKLAEGHIMYAPREYFHEAVEVFAGGPKLYRRPADGKYIDIGYKWDTTSILIASGSYEGKIKALDDMSERWSNTVLPSLERITAYKDTTDPETGETVTAVQQMAQDIKATATAPEIEPSMTAGEQIAAQMAKEAAENYEQGQETLKRYLL